MRGVPLLMTSRITGLAAREFCDIRAVDRLVICGLVWQTRHD